MITADTSMVAAMGQLDDDLWDSAALRQLRAGEIGVLEGRP